MSTQPDMDRQVTVTFDLASLMMFHEVVGFAGFHDPILDHLTDRQQRALWHGSDAMKEVLWTMGIKDWDEAESLAQQAWDKRHPET
jgi:hypothetical protein